jgi:hypothetical protein
MLLWQRHPKAVRGLVLQATALEWKAARYERTVWRLMSLFEASLRMGSGKGWVERALRQAIEASPDLAPWRAWLAGELRRGDPTALAEAGRALSRYDARPFASMVNVPCAVVVTTRDRLVRPRKQRRLAASLHARVWEIAGDHDAPWVLSDELCRVTVQSVDAVAASATLAREAN